MTEPINIDELVEELSDVRKLIITRRALDAYGIPYNWIDGDPPTISIDPIYNPDSLSEDDAFLDLWEREAADMIAADIILKASHQGLIEFDYVDDEGHVVWKLTDGVDISDFEE